MAFSDPRAHPVPEHEAFRVTIASLLDDLEAHQVGWPRTLNAGGQAVKQHQLKSRWRANRVPEIETSTIWPGQKAAAVVDDAQHPEAAVVGQLVVPLARPSLGAG